MISKYCSDVQLLPALLTTTIFSLVGCSIPNLQLSSLSTPGLKYLGVSHKIYASPIQFHKMESLILYARVLLIHLRLTQPFFNHKERFHNLFLVSPTQKSELCGWRSAKFCCLKGLEHVLLLQLQHPLSGFDDFIHYLNSSWALFYRLET